MSLHIQYHVSNTAALFRITGPARPTPPQGGSVSEDRSLIFTAVAVGYALAAAANMYLDKDGNVIKGTGTERMPD
jgi:hypothetical protein